MQHSHYSLKGFPLMGEHYRPFCLPWWKHYLNPKTYINAVKYFIQRGWRGYADCDHWDIDSYMETILLGTVKDLRKYAHGFPANLVSDDATEVLNAEYVDGMTRWHGILDEIIDGLEASIDLRKEITIPKGVYSDEPFLFVPYKDNEELLQLAESDTPRFNKELYDEWAAPLKKRKRRALLLLAKHWESLWD